MTNNNIPLMNPALDAVSRIEEEHPGKYAPENSDANAVSYNHRSETTAMLKRGKTVNVSEKQIPGSIPLETNDYTFEDKEWNNIDKSDEYKQLMSDRGKLLSARQKLPLDAKVNLAKNRIRKVVAEYGLDKCVINFSGGKDSTVLSHIILSMGYKMDHYYINTRLEYPECVAYVKEWTDKHKVKLITMVPDIMPIEVWKKFGYPMFTKEVADTLYRLRKGYKVAPNRLKRAEKFLKYKRYRISDKCCYYLKKAPTVKFFKKNDKIVSIIGTTAEESRMRRINWVRKGCIYKTKGQVICNPIIFFNEADIYAYVKKHRIKLASIYAKGMRRNGCFCCGFGCHKKDENTFLVLKRLYPNIYPTIMDKWGFRKICKQCDVDIGEETK